MSINHWRSAHSGLMLSLGLLGILLIPRHAVSDEPATSSTTKSGHIIDAARMFDPQLVDFVDADLERLSQLSKVPILIETVNSLDGQTVHEAVSKKKFAPGTDGVYVLLAKKERKIEVRVSNRFVSVIGQADQKAIREGFIEGLKASPEEGVTQGVQALSRVFRKARRTELTEQEPAAAKVDEKNQGSPLIVRNQVGLALSGARRIIEVAEAKASEMGLKVNIAVVDDGGHLLAFARMDGGRPASGYTAITKATTAATFRQETGPLPRGATEPNVLLNLSLQNAAAASGGKITTLFGGVPVIVDDQVIGGVGVGGGTGEQDAMVAKAGIEALLTELKASQSPPASETKTTQP